MACGSVSEVNLAEGEELEKVKELIAKLEPEISKLKEEGKDFDHTTGDLFFTRLLRGNNGSMDESVEWYRKFITLRSNFGLDDIHKECEEKNTLFVASQMPHYKEAEPYCTTVFDENDLRCPSGHLMWYECMGDLKSKQIITELGEEKYLKFMHFQFERRTSTLNKISRKEGKIVKITRVMDFEGATLASLSNKEFKALDAAKLRPVLTGTSIETVHLCFLINFPSVFVKAFDVVKLVFPARLVARFRVLGTNYMQDKEYLTECGADITKRIISYSKVRAADTGEREDPFAREGSGEGVSAGTVVERVTEVQPGQTVSWQYSIGQVGEAKSGGFFSKLAGKVSGSEVFFGVKAIWTDKQAGEIELLSAKVRSAGVDEGDAAEFFVGGNAVDYTASAGVNLVAVNPLTRELILGKAFDMTKDSDAANQQFVDAIKELPRACFVLVGVKGTGAEELSSESWQALQDCGSTIKGGGHWHKGYALAGVKGGSAVSEMRGGNVIAEGDLPTQEYEADLLPPVEVNAESGEQTGSIKVDREGMVILRWSNEHAMVAAKTLANYKIAVE